MSVFFYQFGSIVEDLYYNPTVVFIAMGVLVFLVAYTVLVKRRMFGGNKGISAIVSLVMGILTMYYAREYVVELQIMNVFILLAALGVLYFIFRPVVLRFWRR